MVSTVEEKNQTGIHLELNDFDIIGGIVKDQSGKPLSGIWISVWSSIQQSGHGTFTKDDGSFFIEDLPKSSDYLVTAESNSGLPYVSQSKSNISSNNTGIVFTLYTGWTLTGKVLDINGKGIDAAGITLDKNGNIYITSVNDHCIYVYNQQFKNIAKWGQNGIGNGELSKPRGLLFDKNEKFLYVVDSDNNRVQRFTNQGVYYDRWGPGNNQGELNNPKGLVLDNQENLYVADKTNHRIQVFQKDGSFKNVFPNLNETFVPSRMAINSNQQIYVTDEDHHKIFVFEKNGQKKDDWQNQDLHFPNDIEIDSNNMIYVANTGNNNILKFNQAGDIQGKYSCKNSLSEPHNLLEPYGLAIGNDKTLVVADTGHNRIVRIYQDDQCEEILTTYSFKTPYDIEIDDDNNIYVVDTNNYSIKKFSEKGELITEIFTKGYLSGKLERTMDFAISNQGQSIYIADFGNHRIQKFKQTQTTTKDMAIIIAGGGRYHGNKLWNATQLCAYMAYRALINRGLEKETSLKMLSPVTTIDMDGNNLYDDITVATPSQLEKTIHWADGARNLILYLVDHGAHQQFLMNEYDSLNAYALDKWLHQISVLNHIMIVYDACKAESFLSVLKNADDQRIIITSAKHEAYFIAQGVLSFSYYFWKNIIHGNNFQDSFYQAQKTINDVTRGLQTARMEPQIFDFIIGDVNNLENSIPAINGISYTSNTLYATIQKDDDITVKGIIVPPDYKQIQTSASIINFPSITLYGENGIYQATYDDPFHIGKDHYIIIQASNKFGISTTDEIYLTGLAPVKRKAIIISGDSDNLMAAGKISLIVDALSFQGYSKEDITIVAQEPIFHLPQTELTEDNIKQAILQCKSNEVKEMILCLNNIDENVVSFEKLNTWLNEVEQEMQGKMVIINDSPYSKHFMDSIDNDNRIIVSSTTVNYPTCQSIETIDPEINSMPIRKLCLDQNNYFCANTCDLFSTLFWNAIWSGLEINDAFRESQENMMMISSNYKNAFSLVDNRITIVDNNKRKSNNIGLGIQFNTATFPGSLDVVITNESNLSPISNAFISFNSLISGCSTENGRYHTIIEPSKNIEVTVLANGYERHYTTISIEEGEYKTISIALTPSESYVYYSVACAECNNRPLTYNSKDDVKTASCFIDIVYRVYFFGSNHYRL